MAFIQFGEEKYFGCLIIFENIEFLFHKILLIPFKRWSIFKKHHKVRMNISDFSVYRSFIIAISEHLNFVKNVLNCAILILSTSMKPFKGYAYLILEFLKSILKVLVQTEWKLFDHWKVIWLMNRTGRAFTEFLWFLGKALRSSQSISLILA